MATKADLLARIAVLERNEQNALAAFDEISAARGLSGVRVIGDWSGGDWSILVISSGTPPEDAMKYAGIFRHALELCHVIMELGNEAIEAEGAKDGDDA